MKSLLKFLSRKDGATAIEYAVVASMIGLTIIVAATGVGSEVAGVFTDVSSGFARRGG
jgi:pilus assembly protein Flp/PilA